VLAGLLVSDAEVEIASVAGARRVGLEQFPPPALMRLIFATTS